MKFRRKISFSERGHLGFSKVLPVYINQMVIEGVMAALKMHSGHRYKNA